MIQLKPNELDQANIDKFFASCFSFAFFFFTSFFALNAQADPLSTFK
jgi:hypothetical protein